MSRTNELRELVTAILNIEPIKELGVKNVSYEVADCGNLFPHIVFSFDSAIETDLNRKDYSIIIDIYDKDKDDVSNAYLCEQIADIVEDLFCGKNMPQAKILPTFYLERRTTIKEDNKNIKHKQLEIIAKLYDA